MAQKKKHIFQDYRVVMGDKKFKVRTRTAVNKLLKDCATGHVFKGSLLVALRKAGKTTWL